MAVLSLLLACAIFFCSPAISRLSLASRSRLVWYSCSFVPVS